MGVGLTKTAAFLIHTLREHRWSSYIPSRSINMSSFDVTLYYANFDLSLVLAIGIIGSGHAVVKTRNFSSSREQV